MTEITRVGSITSRDFKRRFLDLGRPVILTKAIEHWPARHLWTPEYFITRFGHAEVEVETLPYDKASVSSDYLRSMKRAKLTIAEYLDFVYSNPAPPAAGGIWLNSQL